MIALLLGFCVSASILSDLEGLFYGAPPPPPHAVRRSTDGAALMPFEHGTTTSLMHHQPQFRVIRIIRLAPPVFSSPMDEMLRSLDLGDNPFAQHQAQRTISAIPLFNLWAPPSSQFGGSSSGSHGGGFSVRRVLPSEKNGQRGAVVVEATLEDLDESKLQTHILSGRAGGKSLVISGATASMDGSRSMSFQRTFRLPASSVERDEEISARFNRTSGHLTVTVPQQAGFVGPDSDSTALPFDDGIDDGIALDDEWDVFGRSLHSAASSGRGGGFGGLGNAGSRSQPLLRGRAAAASSPLFRGGSSRSVMMSPLEMMFRAFTYAEEEEENSRALSGIGHDGAASNAGQKQKRGLGAETRERDSSSEFPVFWRFEPGALDSGGPKIRVHLGHRAEGAAAPPPLLMPVLRDGENLDLEMRADNDATVGPYARVHLPVSPLSVAGSSGTGSTDDSVAGSSGSVATLAVDPNDVTQIPIRAEL